MQGSVDSLKDRGGTDDEKGNLLDDENYRQQHQQSHPSIPRFIILHYSPFKTFWDWITLLLVLYTAVCTPYTAAFMISKNASAAGNNTFPPNSTSSNLTPHPSSGRPKFLQLLMDGDFDPLTIIDMTVDIMFIADILINFRTTFIHNGEVITNPMKIASNYVQGWFLIDAVAAIPFDVLLRGTGTSDVSAMCLFFYSSFSRYMHIAHV